MVSYFDTLVKHYYYIVTLNINTYRYILFTMRRYKMSQNSKDKVFDAVKKAYPLDLSIVEVARETKLNRVTASTWLRVLEAEGKIVVSRKVGPVILYRLKKK